MSKKRLTSFQRDKFTNLKSMMVNADDYEAPFNDHTLLIFCRSDDGLFLGAGFSKAEFKEEEPSLDGLYNVFLTKLKEVSQESTIHQLNLKDPTPLNVSGRINMAANLIARNTRRGAGNIIIASQTLYNHLSKLECSESIQKAGEEEHLVLNYNIRVYQLDNFGEVFPDCEGILMYWGTPSDGPLSVRYKYTDNSVVYDIVTIEQISNIKDSNNGELVSSTSDYIVRLAA